MVPGSETPIGAPTFATVEETERYSGPSDWVAPEVARKLALGLGVKLVALETERRWFGMRERLEITVCGSRNKVESYWNELEDAAGLRRGWRFGLWDMIWP